MGLQIGTRIGAYEVVAAIGAGGMGEVYRARDTVLPREVALKILPDSLAADPDRLARFEQEGRLLASVSHSGIAQVYGVEPYQSSRAIVMELVPGPTLAERLLEGALGLTQSLRIARQIAEAVAAAHEKGIIHRDLKPANIKASDDGVVKLLDFGLAKALIDDTADSDVSTIVSPAMTSRGVILGTAAYMSPEQARGKAIDRRTDVWAFGCVLFEMLSGTRAFDAASVPDTIVAVLSREPDWSRLPSDTPPAIRLLLRRCLERDRGRRIADLHDAALEIDDQLSAPASTAAATEASAVTARVRGRWIPWILGTLAVALVALPGLQWSRRAPVELRVDVVTPSTTDPAMFALSPDGFRIVSTGSAGRIDRLWLRDLRSESAVGTLIAGTDGATFPFWSPDGNAIGFFANGRLKIVDLATSTVRDLTAAPVPRGGTWAATSGGTILYALGLSGGIWRIAAAGGAAQRVAGLESGQIELRHPTFFADGKRFVFTAQTPDERGLAGGLFIANLDGGSPVHLSGEFTRALPLPGNRLMFRANGGLSMQRLDGEGSQLIGTATQLTEAVQGGLLGEGGFSANSNILAYRRPALRRTQLQWFDRTGSPMATVGGLGRTNSVDLSPDGRHVVMANSSGTVTMDFETGRERIQMAGGRPIWLPDGRSVLAGSSLGILLKPIDTDDPEKLVLAHPNAWPSDVSPDGRTLIYVAVGGQTSHDLWKVDIDGRAKPEQITNATAREYQGQLSPNGEWLAFTSNETGEPEIWIRRLIGSGQAIRASTAGGMMPRWRRDGRELFYLAPDATLTALPIEIDGNRVSLGRPTDLFQAQVPRDLLPGSGISFFYDVSADGRFLICVDQSELAPVTVVLNWRPPLLQ